MHLHMPQCTGGCRVKVEVVHFLLPLHEFLGSNSGPEAGWKETVVVETF